MAERPFYKGPTTCFVHKPDPFEFLEEQLDHFFKPFSPIVAHKEVATGYFVNLETPEVSSGTGVRCGGVKAKVLTCTSPLCGCRL